MWDTHVGHTVIQKKRKINTTFGSRKAISAPCRLQASQGHTVTTLNETKECSGKGLSSREHAAMQRTQASKYTARTHTGLTTTGNSSSGDLVPLLLWAGALMS